MSCRRGPWPWQALVHVCQRWRRIIFTWPLHLDVRLDCNPTKTDVANLLDVWPTLPISLESRFISNGDGIINKLKHRDRIVRIKLRNLTGIQLEKCAILTQESFPFLRSLHLSLHPDADDYPMPENFFSGSIPRLRKLTLMAIQFPTLPKLLLSARDLVTLHLGDVTSTEYISPDTIAPCLSTLTKLQLLRIDFLFQGLFSNSRNPSRPLQALQTRALLPSLSVLMFEGVSEYSEDLMSRIDAPVLDRMLLAFFYHPTFDIPELPQFLHRSKVFKPLSKVKVSFCKDALIITLFPSSDSGYFSLEIPCTGLHRQLSFLNHFFTQTVCLPLLSHVCQLRLFGDDQELDQGDPMQNLRFLRSFHDVQVLDISGSPRQDYLEIYIARVLGELTRESAAEVLPMMHTLMLSSYGCHQVRNLVTTLLKPFIDARQLSGQPVEVR
jgi:hypothetical protein